MGIIRTFGSITLLLTCSSTYKLVHKLIDFHLALCGVGRSEKFEKMSGARSCRPSLFLHDEIPSAIQFHQLIDRYDYKSTNGILKRFFFPVLRGFLPSVSRAEASEACVEAFSSWANGSEVALKLRLDARRASKMAAGIDTVSALAPTFMSGVLFPMENTQGSEKAADIQLPERTAQDPPLSCIRLVFVYGDATYEILVYSFSRHLVRHLAPDKGDPLVPLGHAGLWAGFQEISQNLTQKTLEIVPIGNELVGAFPTATKIPQFFSSSQIQLLDFGLALRRFHEISPRKTLAIVPKR